MSELILDKVVEQNKLLRTHNRVDRQGYSKDKTMRHILSFDASVLFHPEFSKFFDKQMDKHEARKNLYNFAKRHPEYVVVDSL